MTDSNTKSNYTKPGLVFFRENSKEKKTTKIQAEKSKTTTTCQWTSATLANTTVDTNSNGCEITSLSSQPDPIKQTICDTSHANSNARSTIISTFNVENFTTNALYLSELLSKVEILVIQEHWLWSFEKSRLDNFAAERGFSCFLKCTDEYDPIDNRQRIRGWGWLWALMEVKSGSACSNSF